VEVLPRDVYGLVDKFAKIGRVDYPQRLIIEPRMREFLQKPTGYPGATCVHLSVPTRSGGDGEILLF